MALIGERIKSRRKKLNMSAEELAEKSGKSRATIYKYEKGDIEELPYTVIIPIAEALETTPLYLLGLTEEEEITETELFASNVAELLKEEKIELRGLILDLMKLNDDQVKAIRAVVNSYL